MLNLTSRRHLQLCDRLSRRKALEIGALGPLAVGLPQLLQSAANASVPTAPDAAFGRAKRVILLFMWGGPAHQDTWDLKPDGPVGNRGEFLPIATNVPGIHISEHFPHIARHADKLAVIRSVGQEDNNHSTGAHAGLTGRRHERQAENFGAQDSDFPHYGSVLSALRPTRGGLPTFVALPDIIATTAGAVTPGQGGGILGRAYDPFRITDHPDEPDFSIESLRLPEGINLGRMDGRRQLLRQMETLADVADRSPGVQAMDAFYRRALDMVLSPDVRRSFDLSRVSEEERWRYGWHTFGQSTLLARRLIEAGVKLVTVYWHREEKTIDSSWDTHSLNFQELKNRLMPSVDRPIAALLEDLEAKGLLDETLIVWNSEFGRTPRINPNAGRDHWGPCNSVVMAGGGMPGGQVFGASDKQAAYPTRDKVTQDDIAATIYHLLGISPHTPIYDRLNRPLPVALGGPIHKLLGLRSQPEPTTTPPPLPLRRKPGPFYQMLIDRGRRFLCCEFGNPTAEKEWQLTGWSAPTDGYRTPQTEAAKIKYLGLFHAHFDYGFVVFRLAQPQAIANVVLSVGGREVPIPDELINSEPQSVWQIPFPAGMIAATKTFELFVNAPDWQVSEMALVGDRIRERHLERIAKFV